MLVAILLLSAILILTVQVYVDILQNKFLTKRERTNLLTLVILFPGVSYLIYYYYYKDRSRNRIR